MKRGTQFSNANFPIRDKTYICFNRNYSINGANKIPLAVDSEVMYLSDLKCCIHPEKKGDHIHHIDGNNSNNNIENLVLLCFDCHNLATIKGSLSKNIVHSIFNLAKADKNEEIKNKINDLYEDLRLIYKDRKEMI